LRLAAAAKRLGQLRRTRSLRRNIVLWEQNEFVIQG
jgi:hypothetical protein